MAVSAEVDVGYESNFTPDKFKGAVAKCVEYIEAGDIFQVVISQRLELATGRRSFGIVSLTACRKSEPLYVFLAYA